MNGKEGISNIVMQINDILIDIESNLYKMPLGIYNGSSIGQHFRHIYDFFRCLVYGAQENVVDYASRERDLQIEQDPRFALAAFHRELDYLLTLDEQMPLSVRADFSTQSDVGRPEYPSSVGRELMFVHDHAVHHLAMIKIGLQNEAPDLLKDKNFGVAPSTIKFRQQEA
ncbi:MAG: DinB family protein [Haliscomenobacter sp.]|nr:DinB family protein [Haliscomenobacter sp.]MBK9491560.1 DinB family protein [Haliscomenobacter sp.]